jgi:hypothetical protein
VKNLPGTLPNSYVISSAGVPCNADHLHFTADGEREMGRRYAEKMLNLMGYQATEPKKPCVKSCAARQPSAETLIVISAQRGRLACRLGRPARCKHGNAIYAKA